MDLNEEFGFYGPVFVASNAGGRALSLFEPISRRGVWFDNIKPGCRQIFPYKDKFHTITYQQRPGHGGHLSYCLTVGEGKQEGKDAEVLLKSSGNPYISQFKFYKHFDFQGMFTDSFGTELLAALAAEIFPDGFRIEYMYRDDLVPDERSVKSWVQNEIYKQLWANNDPAADTAAVIDVDDMDDSEHLVKVILPKLVVRGRGPLTHNDAKRAALTSMELPWGSFAVLAARQVRYERSVYGETSKGEVNLHVMQDITVMDYACGCPFDALLIVPLDFLLY